MAIATSSCFDYVAEFKDDSFKTREIVVQASRREGIDQMIVGDYPKLRFWEDRLVLIAVLTSSPCRWISFPVGDVVFFSARPGDHLRVRRTPDAAFALSIERGDDLVLALGALSRLTLASDIEVVRSVNGVSVSVGGEQAHLRPRESMRLGPYDVYIERGGHPDPEPDAPLECVSIVRTGDIRASNAAIRSAVLLGEDWFHGFLDELRGELADGTYIRAPRVPSYESGTGAASATDGVLVEVANEVIPAPESQVEHWWRRILPSKRRSF